MQKITIFSENLGGRGPPWLRLWLNICLNSSHFSYNAYTSTVVSSGEQRVDEQTASTPINLKCSYMDVSW